MDVGWVVHRINANLKQRPNERYRALSGSPGEMPPDLPVHLFVERVMAKMPTEYGETLGLLGHTMDMEFYTMGVGGGQTLTVKLYRDPVAIAVYMDGEELYRWVQDDGDLPSTVAGVIAEQVRKDGEWVAQVDLKDGDFVHDDGTIEREDDELLEFDDEDELLPVDEDEDDDYIEGEVDP